MAELSRRGAILVMRQSDVEDINVTKSEPPDLVHDGIHSLADKCRGTGGLVLRMVVAEPKTPLL